MPSEKPLHSLNRIKSLKTMSQAQPFNPLTIAIEGTNLIEASAGTGKTYGIAALFTRLIVLEHMPVESVLVVTFTKAATAELKTRLRARLDDVLQILERVPDAAADSDGIESYLNEYHQSDRFLADLMPQALARESQARLIVRLKAAINQFDNAAIYTIHGFCQRVLRDYAFLCQAPFDMELSHDNHERMLTPAQDFWRLKVSNQPELARLVFKHKYTPQKMLDKIRAYISRPYLTFRRPDNGELTSARQQLEATWQSVRQNLPKLKETFWRIHPTLNGKSYGEATFSGVFAVLEQAAAANYLPDNHEKLPMFAADFLQSKVKGKNTPDLVAFADLQQLANLGRDLSALATAEQNTLIALQLDLLAHINAALAEQKKSRHERGFDDLLLDVHHALTDNPHRDELARTVAQNWRVALIDEFQDTDPLQYEIFSKIFMQQGNPLFLVGDPKQAIYSFRGADIYAYLQAATDAQHHYTLDTNYRSHSKLINGIGALFRQKNRPFVLDNITYSEVGAAREACRLNPVLLAIQVRWLNEKDEKPNKDILRARAAGYCADEIAHALNEAAEGRLNFKDRPLASGDIAVLVRTHNEGSMIAAALKKRRIQSVLLSRDSVFNSPEARAIAALLDFWIEPRHTESLRFALSSILFEYDAQALYQLNQNENVLLEWIASAQNAAEQWQQQGIYAAMQQFAARHQIEHRLIACNNERSLTNYHQILERLSEEDEQSRSPSSLHQWLLEQITLSQTHSTAEEHALRLESDEALVKIVTMHASKGLQYPLVYCPFVWDATENKPNDWQILHRPDQNSELLAKSQLNDEDTRQLADEEMAERLRLLYVALTRAEEQLHIYAASCSDTPDNTFAYLLEGSPDSSREAVNATYKAEKNTADMLKNNWIRFIENAPEHTEFAFVEGAPESAVSRHQHTDSGHYQALSVPKRGFSYIRHTSFTGLSSHVKTHDSEREELQPSIEPSETVSMPSENIQAATDEHDIHHFPRGTQAGVCLHEMLEKLDFAQAADTQSDMLQKTLEYYGFEEKWLPAVCTMLDHSRTASLTTQSLADMPSERRLPEMGFTLYMQDFRLQDLQQWFAQPHLNLPPECIEAAKYLDFKDVQGYLNGFIDMVCQDSDGIVSVIDYKSNYLGESAAAYTPQAMNEAMAEHHYYLQALIYAIAVARYFKVRNQALPKIAIRYLFLRGMDGSDNGIWRWNLDTADLGEWL